jgi:hypothetical protein
MAPMKAKVWAESWVLRWALGMVPSGWDSALMMDEKLAALWEDCWVEA